MTPLQQFIDESQAKCDAATPGPWRRDSAAPHSIKSHNGTHVATIFGNLDPEDVAFTTHARTALPVALQHLRELSKERDKWKFSYELILREHNQYQEAVRKHLETLPHPPLILAADDAELIKQNEALTCRVAELEQRIADMQDEQRNPPTLRTVCEKDVT